MALNSFDEEENDEMTEGMSQAELHQHIVNKSKAICILLLNIIIE